MIAKQILGAEIRDLGGVPTLFVEGAPKGPMTFQWGMESFAREDVTHRQKSDQLARMAEAGIEIFFPRLDVGNPDLVDTSAKELDDLIGFLLDAAPQAYVIPWITVWPYAEFGRKYPDDVITFDDGQTGPWTNHTFMRLETPDTPRYTFASEAWARENEQMLVRLLDHVNRADYARHVIGYFFFGQCFEWSYFWDWDRENRSIDYSPAMQAYFRKWLKKAYGGDVAALRAAWRDPVVDFDSAPLPSKEQKSKSDFGFFWDPDASRPAIDYFSAHNQAIADQVVHLAKVVKRETDGRALTGFFWGYIHQSIYSGQAVFKSVLEADEVDFWSSPHLYENRGPGDHAMFRFLNKTLKDHGKLWVAECDTFMHDSRPYTLRHHGYPRTTREQTIDVLKREFSYVLCEGANGWWVDWAMGKSLYEAPILSLIRRMQRVSQASLDYPRGSATDIAVVVDQESLLAMPHHQWGQLTYLLVNRARIHELPRIGTPVDYCELDDVLREDAQSYKMYIFLVSFTLDTQERERIERRLKRDGNTLVWIYALGLIDPNSEPALSVAHMEALTGLRLGHLPQRHQARIKIDNYADPITALLAPGTEFGDYERAITSGFQMNKDTMEPIQPPPTMVDPLFYVKDGKATVLGHYLESDKPAFAVKRFDDWTSVYLGSPGVSAGILRAIARAAQVHLYVDGEDIVYANESFIAIHTGREGHRIVHLRQPTDTYEAFDDQVLGRNVSSVPLNLPAFTTRLLFVGDADEFRKKLES